MKKPDKLKYEEIPEVPAGENLKKKKLAKPWVLEYSPTNAEQIKLLPFIFGNKVVGTWYEDNWYKWISIEDALKNINKDARSYTGVTSLLGKGDSIKDHWKFANKIFRLRNKETGNLVPLSFTDREVYAESEQSEHSERSSGNSPEI